jgi:hypothetical protein
LKFVNSETIFVNSETIKKKALLDKLGAGDIDIEGFNFSIHFVSQQGMVSCHIQ